MPRDLNSISIQELFGIYWSYKMSSTKTIKFCSKNRISGWNSASSTKNSNANFTIFISGLWISSIRLLKPF